MTLAALGAFVKSNFLLIVAFGGLAVVLGLHAIWYIHPSDVKTYADLQTRLTNGRPAIVEFYSNL